MKKSRIARPIAAVESPAVRSLPLVDLLVDTKAELFELMVRSGLRVLDAMLEEDRTALCGPRYAHQPARAASRTGRVPSDVVVGGRKVAVSRPRVRADGREVPLPTFQALAHTDPLNRRVVEQMLVGVATRQYARSLEPLPADVVSRGTSKSSVSRRFVAKTTAQLRAWQSAPLDGLDLVALLLDGVHIGEHCLVVALGISLMGLAVLFEFQVFIPIYLSGSFALSPAQAGMASSVFPLGCLITVFAGGFVYDKLSKKALTATLGGMSCLGLLCLALLLMLPSINLNPRSELVLTIGTIFLFGCAISPAYYLPMSVFSISFGGRHCGLLIGLIDAIGYTGALVFDFVGGSVADQPGGWQSFLTILVLVSLTVTVTMTLFLHLDSRHSLPLRKYDLGFQT